MTCKELQHSFSALEEMRPCRIIKISLTRVERIKPVCLSGRLMLGAGDERLEEAVPDEPEWSSERGGQSEDAEGEGERSKSPGDE